MTPSRRAAKAVMDRENLIKETWRRQRRGAARDLVEHGAFRCAAMAYSAPLWEQLQKDKMDGVVEFFLFVMDVRSPLIPDKTRETYHITCEGVEVETGLYSQ